MYDAKFYDTIESGVRSSAETLVPLLIKELGLHPGCDVVDVGCGAGWWAQVFDEHGMNVIGLDGDWHGDHMLGSRFKATDLSKPIPPISPSFDLAISLEVAEHLPRRRAAGFIADLCKLAPVVVFSAAIPGQGGTNHLNEAWPDYWTRLFNDNGFAVNGEVRYDIWDDDRIENWYCVPDDAEILTSAGWKMLGDLGGSESVLTCSMDDGSLNWESMLGLTVMEYDGDLIEVAGRWKTTPDHRWPVVSQTGGKPKFRTAADVVVSDRIMQVGSRFAGPPVRSALNERDAAILGWLVTDGHFRIKPKNGRPQGCIHQSPKKFLDEIVELLGDEGGVVQIDQRPSSHGCASINVRVSALNRIMVTGYRSKDDLVDLVLRLDVAALRSMWEAMMAAEGSVNTGSLTFAQDPGPVADAFQLISFLLGFRVNLVQSNRHSVGGTGNGTKSGRSVAVKSKPTSHYAGKVWCPTTPSGTWVMRQNGAIAITGNCQNLLICGSGWSQGPMPLSLVHPVLYDARRK